MEVGDFSLLDIDMYISTYILYWKRNSEPRSVMNISDPVLKFRGTVANFKGYLLEKRF